jgi:L-serine/L-threonine ammonia-lyase
LDHLKTRTDTTSTPHFYSSSGGNAGLACVAAANTLGFPSTVIVPLSTKPHMIDKIRQAGATEVFQFGPTWFDADTHLRNDVLPADPGGVYVPPFDHPAVWAGHQTMVPEIIEDLGGEPDAVVCSVGGGGLFIGIAQGLEGTQTRIAAVETKGAESLHEAIKAKKLVTLPGITSLATSLGALKVAPKALECGLQENVTSLVVTDAEACRACVRFAEDERALVEPACGATIALVYEGRLKEVVKDLKKDSRVVLVVCGGRNIGLDLLKEWREIYV